MPVRTVEGLSTVEVDVGERPASDPLAMERARARAERALFGHAAPATVGRYEVLDPIASGGMGFVYAAHDPELDRRVALKVLHPDRRRDGSAQDRLIKEARALARLDHPNIVPVHDALTHDGELVIVMELVTGETLESWQAAAPRGWREVVAAYAQAGAGLAAAHGLDIIHRDFKPSNAIMGADGRVRVLDFGLARFVGEGPEAGRTGSPQPGMMATASGAILGTLAYAAPEQLAGTPVTAASDQFSFCVALHRALEGVAPFRGATAGELLASIERDPPALAGDGRRVPGWLRAVVRRGLATEPARRHASMQAVLHELARPRGWKRWRWPVIAVGLVAATAAATLGLREAAGRQPACDDDPGLAAVWGPWRRVALAARLQQLGTHYVSEVQDRVLDTLDRWTGAWTSVHRTACVAHWRGAESDALFDRKMLCLRQRLDDVTASLRVLDGLGRDALSRAIDVVAGSRPPAMCDDTARLLDEPEPPAAPERLAEVTAVRAHVSTGAALGRAGLAEQAIRTLAEASVEAERTDHAPVIAEARLAYGRALMVQDRRRATPVLRDAMMRALATGQSSLAVEAAARRIYTEGTLWSDDLQPIARDVDIIEPMSRALTADHFARPLLLNNIGAVYMAAGQRDAAMRYFWLANEEIGPGAPADLELAAVSQNLAMLTPDPAARARLSIKRWNLLRARLGEHHLDTLDAQICHGYFGADPREAYELIHQACDAYREFHPAFVALYVDCQRSAGLLASELGRGEAAQAAYTAIVEATRGASDADLIVWRRLAAGELALIRGDLGEVRAELTPVVEARGNSESWWVRKDALQAELVLGLAAAGAGDRAAATRHLEVAARGLAELARKNEKNLYRLALSRAQRALAAVTGDFPERGAAEHH